MLLVKGSWMILGEEIKHFFEKKLDTSRSKKLDAFRLILLDDFGKSLVNFICFVLTIFDLV